MVVIGLLVCIERRDVDRVQDGEDGVGDQCDPSGTYGSAANQGFGLVSRGVLETVETSSGGERVGNRGTTRV